MDLVFVPPCWFLSRGNRLGRGGGFYDRELPLVSKKKRVFVGFDWQVRKKLPIEPHDQKIKWIISESGIRPDQYMKKILFILPLLILVSSQLHSISYQILAFRSYGDPNPKKMLLIGKVTGKGQSLSTQRRRILDYDTRELVLTAKLNEEDGLRVGDKIFIIQKKTRTIKVLKTDWLLPRPRSFPYLTRNSRGQC